MIKGNGNEDNWPFPRRANSASRQPCKANRRGPTRTVDCERGLGNVGGEDDLAGVLGCRLEDLELGVGGKRAVERTDSQPGTVGGPHHQGLAEQLLERFDLVLPHHQDRQRARMFKANTVYAPMCQANATTPVSIRLQMPAPKSDESSAV